MGRLEKSVLRTQLVAVRKGFDPVKKVLWDSQITARTLDLLKRYEKRAVLCFIGTNGEIDTKPLIEALWAEGIPVYAPRCQDRDGAMTFFAIKSWADVEEGMYGILEPKALCPPLPNNLSAICILPGLCFSMGGDRLGYGKGYYDRFFAKRDAIKVGICYNECIMPTWSVEQHDCNMDWVVTQSDVVHCNE